MHIEHYIFAKLLEIKGLKMLRNVILGGSPCCLILNEFFQNTNFGGEDEWILAYYGNNKYQFIICHQGGDGVANLHHDSVGGNPHVLIKFVSLLFECDF